jgi:hypothetical protein
MTGEPAPERKSNLDISEAHQMRCLDAIGRFGWIRPKELSKLIWQDSENGQKFAERLLRLLRDKKLVLARQLPGRSKAYVLTLRGSKTINEFQGSDFIPGVRWGRVENGVWTAPDTWRHDLITTGVLIHFEQQGFDVFHDWNIRRAHPDVMKIPDGIIVKGKACYWIEVENSHKTGDHLVSMCKSIVAICNGKQDALMGAVPTASMIAYDQDATDYRGHRLDHLRRVTSGLGNLVDDPIRVVSVPLEIKNHGVNSVGKLAWANIKPTRHQAIAQKIKSLKWTKSDSPDAESYAYETSQFKYRIEKQISTGLHWANKYEPAYQMTWWRLEEVKDIWLELAKVWELPRPGDN